MVAQGVNERKKRAGVSSVVWCQRGRCGALTVRGDDKGSLGEPRSGGEKGQGEEQGHEGEVAPPRARPPAL